MNNFKQIASILSKQVEEICRYLLPNGKKIGNEWCVGSINGEPGESLKVHLVGEKAGIWSDFNEGSRGDLIELWAKIKGMNKGLAMDDIKKYLGIADAPKTQQLTTSYKLKKGKLVEEGSVIYQYLTEDRKLSPEVIKLFLIEELKNKIVFPFYKDGQRIFSKYLNLERPNGKKIIISDSGAIPCLFGWHLIPDNKRMIVICEGEIDAMSFLQYGVHALSIPYGGGKGKVEKWIGSDRESLKNFETIFICMDQDEAGEISVKEIAENLGKERCVIVDLPHKDINDCLKFGVPKEEIKECFRNATPYIKSKFNNVVSISNKSNESILETVSLDNIKTKKVQWLWNERIAYGKITLIAGEPGIGKSQLLLYVASIVSNGGKFHFQNDFCDVGKVLLFCGEDNSEDTIKPRLNALGANTKNIFVAKGFKKFTKSGNPYYKNVSILDEISYIEKVIVEDKIKLIIFDPISLYLGTTDENNNKEVRAALSVLSDMAERTNVAVILNSHFSKPTGNVQKNAIYRVMGSLGFVAAARIAIAVAKDPEDPRRRLFIPIKNNLSPDYEGLVYNIKPVSLSDGIETSCLQWLDEKISQTANEVLNPSVKVESPVLEKAKEFLLEMLKISPLSYMEIRKRFKEEGISLDRLYTAKKDLMIFETDYYMGKKGKTWSITPFN